ncbi:hypothetical protein MT_57029 [Pseudomonas phage phiPto-bp6g]|nr:hypothetical protein MT_57029 [Pseudomonas phage phiPto-bp6g]
MINNEKREQFIEAFLSGIKVVISDNDKILRSLTGLLYDERAKVKSRDEVIEFCDDIARDTDWSMKCRSCGNNFTPDCELSEMFHAEVYCGRSEFCTP